MNGSDSPMEALPSENLGRLGWCAVFVAGFCGMFLVFFHFYAGVFALELYSARNVDMSIFTRRTLDGTVSIAWGALTCGCLVMGIFGARLDLTRKGHVWLVIAVVLGVLGVATTLSATYAPLMQPQSSRTPAAESGEIGFLH